MENWCQMPHVGQTNEKCQQFSRNSLCGFKTIGKLYNTAAFCKEIKNKCLIYLHLVWL